MRSMVLQVLWGIVVHAVVYVVQDIVVGHVLVIVAIYVEAFVVHVL